MALGVGILRWLKGGLIQEQPKQGSHWAGRLDYKLESREAEVKGRTLEHPYIGLDCRDPRGPGLLGAARIVERDQGQSTHQTFDEFTFLSHT